jgi:hypothetical protein
MPALKDDPARADVHTGMVERLVRTVAIVCSAIVVLSFVMFATDQLSGATAAQEGAVSGQDRTLPAPHREGQPRRFIDGAARDLLSPFASVVTSDNAWGQRTLPTVVALLVYGLGLGFLARSAKALP